jgi:hypothetical protein
MSARIVFPEFRDEQSDSRYPFNDSATLKSRDGFYIPKNCFVDVSVYTINGAVGVFISSIELNNNLVTIRLTDSARQNTCSASYAPLELASDDFTPLPLIDKYGRPAGIIIGLTEGLNLLSGWPLGVHTFTQAATELVASAVVPAQEPGVRGLLEPSGGLLTGDVWLVGEKGVVLRAEADNTIRVDIVGEPLFKRIQCLDETGNPVGDFTPKTFLKTINGCEPDKYGNFTITVATNAPGISTAKTAAILRVYPENNTLKIAAVGSKVF